MQFYEGQGCAHCSQTGFRGRTATGELLALSPYTGEVIGKLDVRDAMRLAPVVANRVVYILTDSGRLIALR